MTGPMPQPQRPFGALEAARETNRLPAATKVGVLNAEVIEAATAAAFETALNAWFDAATSREFRLAQPIEFNFISGAYVAVIIYLEG